MATSISRDQGEWVDFFDANGRRIGSVQMGERHGRRTKLCLDFLPEIRFVRRELKERAAEQQTTPAA